MQMYKLKGCEILKNNYIKKKIYDLKSKQKKSRTTAKRPVINKLLQNKAKAVDKKEHDKENINQSVVEDIEESQFNTAVQSSQYLNRNITLIKNNHRRKNQSKRNKVSEDVREPKDNDSILKKQDKQSVIKRKSNEKTTSAIKTKMIISRVLHH